MSLSAQFKLQTREYVLIRSNNLIIARIMIPNFLTTTAAVKIASNPLVAPASIGIGLGTIGGALIGGAITDSEKGAKIGGTIGGATGGAIGGNMTAGVPGAIGGALVGGVIGYCVGDDIYNVSKEAFGL